MTRKLATLQLTVEYSPEETTPDAIAEALDTLLQTALSTEGVLDECGDVVVYPFVAEPPHPIHVVAEPRNSSPWVDKFVTERAATAQYELFNRLERYYEVEHDFDWDRESVTEVDIDVVDLDKWEAEHPENRDEDDDAEG